MTNPFRHLSWPQVFVINLTLVVCASYVFLQGALNQPTHTTTSAAPVLPTPETAPLYPVNPPQIDQVEYFYGKPGDQVRLRGQNFGTHQWASTLNLGNLTLPDSFINSWSDTIIDFTIPPVALTNPLTLTVHHQTVTGPVLSVYYTSSDPYLKYLKTNSGYSLNLINAPPGSKLTLILPPESNLPPNLTVPVTSANQNILNVATRVRPLESYLQTETGEAFLPLYFDPLTFP